jgi:ATP-dependent Clp endopeptidase proteolytic subunit ClpP
MRIVNASTGNREAEILIYSPIGPSDDPFGDDDNTIDAHSFAKNLRALGPLDSITCRVNCPGGDVFDGLSIYNTLKDHPASVTVCVDGLAASAASFVMQAADPGKLFMAANAICMIHSASCGTLGNARDHEKSAAILGKLDQTIAGTYAKRSGRQTDTFLAMMEAETWMTAQETIDHRLADKITPAANVSVCAGIGMLRRYKNIPTSIAARLSVDRGGDSSVAARLGRLERDDRLYCDHYSVAARRRQLDRDALACR